MYIRQKVKSFLYLYFLLLFWLVIVIDTSEANDPLKSLRNYKILTRIVVFLKKHLSTIQCD